MYIIRIIQKQLIAYVVIAVQEIKTENKSNTIVNY